MYIHIFDCIDNVYELPLLPYNTASVTFLHKSAAVRSVEWIFITEARTWRWLGEYVIFIINIKDWALWSVPSPELQLLAPTVTLGTEGIKGSTNLGKRRLTRHRSALPANQTSSCPRSWSLGNATLVVAERSGWRRVLGASKPRPLARGAHPCRKLACLEALSLAATKLTQRGTGYQSWGHSTQLRISRGSKGLHYYYYYYYY